MYTSPKVLLASALSILPSSSAWVSHVTNCTVPNGTDPNPFQLYTISANNISASFIPYGARLTSLLVPDRDGELQDVAVGYDDPHQYLTDTLTNHTNFGSIVGRYANRIKNGTFELDGVIYDLPKNELDNTQTLHGGKIGYDQRNWTVTTHTSNTITFTLMDTAFQGFPGDVINHVTFSVNSSYTPENPDGLAQMTARTVSISLTERTPVMLSPHIYWNLNAFKDPTVLNDILQMPLSSRYIEIDSRLIPTGEIGDVAATQNGVLDFTQPKLIGEDIESAEGVCGADCTGYDNCFIVDRPSNMSDWTSSPETMVPALAMSSPTTGISMLVTTNQKAIQIYSCNSQNGTIPVKPSQVARNRRDEQDPAGDGNGGGDGDVVDMIQQYGCIVVETEGWIDGINNPQWGQDPYQIFSPETPPAVNLATYVFDTFPDDDSD